MNEELYNKIKPIFKCENVENSNANVNEYSFSGKRLTMANIILKEMALDELLPKKAAEYHKNNYLYWHDLDSVPISQHNCLFVDFQKLFKNGFKTRNGDVRPPRSLSTAMQQMAVIMQCQSQVMFGGVGSAHCDDDLAPFVDLSYKKHYKNGLIYLTEGLSEDTIQEICEKQTYPEICPEDKIGKYAWDMTNKEAKQSAQGLWHNLNTLESRAGSGMGTLNSNV